MEKPSEREFISAWSSPRALDIKEIKNNSILSVVSTNSDFTQWRDSSSEKQKKRRGAKNSSNRAQKSAFPFHQVEALAPSTLGVSVIWTSKSAQQGQWLYQGRQKHLQRGQG